MGFISHGRDPKTYINLMELISFDGFDFSNEGFLKSEQDIIKPQLEEMGFTNIFFRAGESDSFGPLTRVVQATTFQGKVVWFFYG